MLYKNYTNKTIILYTQDTKCEKVVIKPNDKVEETFLPQVVFMIDTFIPFGMKRTPKKRGD